MWLCVYSNMHYFCLYHNGIDFFLCIPIPFFSTFSWLLSNPYFIINSIYKLLQFSGIQSFWLFSSLVHILNHVMHFLTLRNIFRRLHNFLISFSHFHFLSSLKTYPQVNILLFFLLEPARPVSNSIGKEKHLLFRSSSSSSKTPLRCGATEERNKGQVSVADQPLSKT